MNSGYVADKNAMKTQIDDYLSEGKNPDTAFVKLEEAPEYDFCFIKKTEDTKEEVVLEKIEEKGQNYYQSYTIAMNEQPITSVSTEEEAKSVIAQLEEKNASATFSYEESYDVEKKEVIDVASAVDVAYSSAPKEIARVNQITSRSSVSTGVANTPSTTGGPGISLIKPISGVLSSRYGDRSGRSKGHAGLDIAAPKGTPIKAAATGTVTFAAYNSSYGYLVRISHGNGYETWYGHCSELYVKSGQTVSAGDTIAAVGSTGNSTGPHLHLEVRYNGGTVNPQNFVY